MRLTPTQTDRITRALRRAGWALVAFWVSVGLTIGLPALSQVGESTVIHSSVSPQPSTLQLLDQGRALYANQQYEQAIAVWQQAAQQYADTGDQPHRAMVLTYLSLAYQQLGQWSQAQAAIQTSLQLLHPAASDAIPDAHLQLYAQALNAQGRLALTLGQPEAALESWQRATAIYTQANDETGRQGSLINQAQALETLGFYRQSCNVLLLSLAMDRRCDRPGEEAFAEILHTFTAQPNVEIQLLGLRTLGNLLRLMGDLARSQQLLHQGLTIAEQGQLTQAEGHFLLALAETERALYERARERSRQSQAVDLDPLLEQAAIALDYYQQAIQTTSATLNLMQMQAQLQRLSLLLDLREAIALLPISNNRFDAILEPHAIAAQASAILHSPLVDWPPSETGVHAQLNLAHSLIRLSAVDSEPAEDWVRAAFSYANKAVQNARTLADSRAESYALGTLGYLYQQQAAWSEAQQWTASALGIAQSIQANDIAYQWQWQLGQIYAVQHQTQSAIDYYQLAFDTIQVLRRDLASLQPDVQFSFRDDVEPIYRQLVELLLSDEPDSAQLQQARQVIDSLQVAEVENFLRQACSEAELAAIDQVLDQSDATAAFIYTIIQEQQLNVILKLPQTQALRLHRVVQPQADIEETLTTLYQLLQQKLQSQLPAIQQVSQQVYNWLITPFIADFERYGIKTLVFVLDGQLQTIPMSALYNGETYLIQHYAVATIPGLQLFTAPPLADQPLQALVAGLIQPPPGSNLGALPAVAEEVRLIQQALDNTEVLRDQDFTYEALQRSLNVRALPIVHLATHGQFSSQPEDTYIVTGDGDRIDLSQLGALLSDRTQTQPNPIQLLFLSACQTVAGDKRAALGMAGVAVRSGARSTIASLWQVDDEATAELVGQFYRYLASPDVTTKAEALRLAQQALLQNPRFSLPIYWSPFILLGSWF